MGTYGLAEALAGIRPDPLMLQLVYDMDEWPPAMLVRSDSQVYADSIGGIYILAGDNHGRQFFRRSACIDGDCEHRDVLIYYWDDGDGETAPGWWFGPELGSDEVWAHHMGDAGQDGPPRSNWVLHFDGVADDAQFEVIDCSPNGAFRATTATQSPQHVTDAGVDSLMSPPPSPAGPDTVITKGDDPEDFHSKVARVATPQVATSQWDNSQIHEDPQLVQGSGSHTCQNAGEPPESLATLKRKREEGKSGREDQLRDWLVGLDGTGMMLQYYDVLASEFEADLTQIAAVKNAPTGEEPPRSLIDNIDPIFWEIVQIRKMGHKMLFARGVSQL